MSATARSLAIEILTEGEQTREPIDRIRDTWLTRHPLPDPRDIGLVNAMIQGVLRQQGYLDWLINRFARHPLNKMKPRTRQALRLGVFQLLFLHRIPAAAAINETVNGLKVSRQPRWLIDFVNGVLRSINRARATLLAPDSSELPDPARLNHPTWLLDRWQARYGASALEEICRLNNTPPALVLRVQTNRISCPDFQTLLASHNIKARPGGLAPDSLVLDNGPPVPEIPGYDEGLFVVQDQGAQLIGMLMSPLADSPYLDGCAGLGGKTGELAARLPTGGKVIAVEPHLARVALLRANLAKIGLLDRVDIYQMTLEDYARDTKLSFRGILLDVPCSGLGVIRRHPEIRWTRHADDLPGYQTKQLALLTSAAPLLMPGGVLVYATCSSEPEENEEVIRLFLASHPDFTLTPCAPLLPESALPFVTEAGFLQTTPNLSGMDGFFAARLAKSTLNA